MVRNPPNDPPLRRIADHPVARHREAGPAIRVSAKEAEEVARRHLADPELSFYVQSGEEYRFLPIYNVRVAVPLEEIWFVGAHVWIPGALDGDATIVGVSKRTGEILFSGSVHEGG